MEFEEVEEIGGGENRPSDNEKLRREAWRALTFLGPVM